MNILACDACGDEYEVRKDGGGQAQLAIASPRAEPREAAPDDFLSKMLGKPPRGGGLDEYKFDLCYECALAMAVALKRQKADVRAGRRPS